ncbi:thioesterase family protein [Solimicrobium silvestre]|uniref:Thioesterase-like superfamily n=1 Tax=Solimicrobium silvestre TaxID=2099400 RepID=A0A2S9H4Q4_9BURK|nr:thioesterase family protein [Solimicrobium silvestre]PRC94962.1 Thioesterase-like superfamily [Solimicrobium silvestre]
MNLWFRLIWMLLTVRWRKPATIFDTTSLSMRVLPNDLDFNGHVNNGRYFTIADIGRMDFVLRTGAMRIAIEQRALPIVGDAMAKFRKDLKPFERYELQTRLLGWDEKWIFMEHCFVCRGRVAAVIAMRGLFRAKQGSLPPSAFLAELGITTASPPLPDWVRAWSQSCDSLGGVLREAEATADKVN